MRYTPDHPPPPGSCHKLVSLTGVTCDPAQIRQVTADPLYRPYTAIVAAGGACVVTFALEVWLAAGSEALGYSSQRFSLLTTTRVVNELGRPLHLRARWTGDGWLAQTLAGSEPLVFQRQNLKEGKGIHTLFIDVM